METYSVEIDSNLSGALTSTKGNMVAALPGPQPIVSQVALPTPQGAPTPGPPVMGNALSVVEMMTGFELVAVTGCVSEERCTSRCMDTATSSKLAAKSRRRGVAFKHYVFGSCGRFGQNESQFLFSKDEDRYGPCFLFPKDKNKPGFSDQSCGKCIEL